MEKYYNHVQKINVDCFWVYSHEADYQYIVNVENKDDMEKAMEIAEREATRWGGPDEEELEKENIKADFYTKNDD